MIDRSEVNRALAKAIAYKQCGKQREAEQWAAELVRLLDCHNVLGDIWAMPLSNREIVASINDRL